MSVEKIHILLIEDEDPHAELIQRAFEDQDARILIPDELTTGLSAAEVEVFFN